MATNINIDASSKQDYLGTDVNDAIANSDNPSAINPFLTASQIVGGLPTGAIPSNYVTRMSSLEISSPTFEDVPGLSTTVTVTASVKAYCLFSFEASATGADAKVEFRVIVNGETSEIVTVDFAKASNSNGSINFRTTNNLTIGSHVVKVQAQKVGGNKIASLDKGFLFTFALQAPKGETGAGVPIGGTTNQVLSKIDGSDYNTQWVTPASGSPSLDIGTTPIINGTIGRIPFQGVGNVLQQDSGLFWDNVNKRLGVNQPIPTAKLHIDSPNYADHLKIYRTGIGMQMTISGTEAIWGTVAGVSSFAIGGNTSFVVNNGNVGINKQAPTAKLHVKAADATATAVARVENNAGTGDLFKIHGDGWLYNYGNVDIYGRLLIENNTGLSFRPTNINASVQLRPVGNHLQIRPNDGSILGMTFDQVGNVGVNTITPTAKLHVKAAGATDTVVARIENSAGTGDLFNVTGQGKVGVLQAAPTAILHLPAGTASATTAPMKLTAGTNMTTPEAGAIEFDGADFFVTNTSGRASVTTSDKLPITVTSSSPQIVDKAWFGSQAQYDALGVYDSATIYNII